MAILVRDLSAEEGNRLLRIARKGANPVEVRPVSAENNVLDWISLIHAAFRIAIRQTQ